MGTKTTITRTLLVSLITISCAGCYLRPNFGPPGSIYEQRARAVLSDPFPNNDLGPPVVSGRPRGYDRPLSEPTNVQASPYSELSKSKPGPLRRLFNPNPQSVAPVPYPSPTTYPGAVGYPANNYPATAYPPSANPPVVSPPVVYPSGVGQPATYPPPIYPQTGYRQ